jgi:hypothetical protein
MRELKNWRGLGRNRPFRIRGLIVGPPQSDLKNDLLGLLPPDEIDVVLDLTASDQPTPKALRPLIGDA